MGREKWFGIEPGTRCSDATTYSPIALIHLVSDTMRTG